MPTDTAADAAIVRIFEEAGIKLGKREPSGELRDVNELDRTRRTGRLQPTDRNASDILELFGTLKADARYFYVTNQLEAYEDSAMVFTRAWSETIPRDQL